MRFDIGEKSHELKFNLGFIRDMDNLYKVEQYGVEMGVGVSMGYQSLSMYSVRDLVKIIQFAAEGKPTAKAVEKAVEDFAEEHGELETLFDEVKNGLKNSPMTKTTVKSFQKNLEAQNQ